MSTCTAVSLAFICYSSPHPGPRKGLQDKDVKKEMITFRPQMVTSILPY